MVGLKFIKIMGVRIHDVFMNKI